MDAGACAPIDDALVVWPFDDGHGITARDCTGKYPGTITKTWDGGIAWTPGRDGGYALTFEVLPDGSTGGDVVPPVGSELDKVGGAGTTGPKPFTIMTWFNGPDGYDYPHALASRNNNGEAWVWGITGMMSQSGNAALSLTFTSGGDHYSENFYLVGWTHLATTFDGGTSINFYVNGVHKGHVDIDAGTDEPGDADFHVGSSTAPGHDLTGTLANMRVYTRELTAHEIAALAKF